MDDRARRVLALVAVATGVALRLWILASDMAPVDADEAVVGLMARRILEGDFESFFWGQEYGSAHEAFLVAVLLAARTPGWLAMELVPIGLSAAGALLVWRIGLRLMGRPGAVIAASLFWSASPVFIWLSTKERGFYGSTLVFGLAAVLLTLQLTQRPSPGRALGLGVAVGSGWYASPQSVFLFVPVAAIVAAGLPALGQKGAAGLARLSASAASGTALGALPWIFTNLRTGFASLEANPRIPRSTYGDRFDNFKEGLAAVFGLRRPFTLLWSGNSSRAIYLGVVVLMAVGGLLLARTAAGRAIVVGALAYPFLFAAFPTSYVVGDPRYLYFFFPLATLAAARVLGSLRPPVLPIGLTAIALAAAVWGTNTMVASADPDQRAWDIAPGSVQPLIGALDDLGITHVYADYWVAQRLTWETGGDVAATPVLDINDPRLERVVRDSPNPAYVLFAGPCHDRTIEDNLRRVGVGYSRLAVDRYVITMPERKVRAEELLANWAEFRGVPPAERAKLPACSDP